MRLFVEQLNCDGPCESQSTCEFWINNFQFEIFYDLSKHFDRKETEESKSLDQDEVEQLEQLQDEKGLGRLAINDLPTEMLSNVFSFFTAIDLLVVRGVCQRWRDIVEKDKGLWNHVFFSAADLDVKTTASLLKEMPLLRSVDLCNVHSPEDMTLLIAALCDACWELRKVHFPETCDWHPSPQDLHQLCYFHPRIVSLQLCTKQKLTPIEISSLGEVLSDFSFLARLKLVGFYWHQAELLPELLAKIKHLTSLALPSFPGVTGADLKQLKHFQPELKSLTINTSSLMGTHMSLITFTQLQELKIKDSTAITIDKLNALGKIIALSSLDVNLSNSKKESVISFFTLPHPTLRDLTISNCEFSNDLLACLPQSCPNLRRLVWLNPKDVFGEVTDSGIFAITRLLLLESLEIKSRTVTKAHYPDLAAMRSLRYARINGMRVPGCF